MVNGHNFAFVKLGVNCFAKQLMDHCYINFIMTVLSDL